MGEQERRAILGVMRQVDGREPLVGIALVGGAQGFARPAARSQNGSLSWL